MSKSNCVVNLSEFYQGKSKEEIKAFVDFMDSVRNNVTDRSKLMAHIRGFAAEMEFDLTTKAVAELDTIGKHVLAVDRMSDPKWGGDIKQAALSFYEETSSVVKGAGINSERMTQVKQKAYFGTFISNMQKIGFLDQLKSGQFDRDIRDVIRTGRQSQGLAASDKINQAASIIKTQYAMMNKEMRSAGLLVNYRQDYDGPVVHSGSQIFGNFDKWVSALDDALDFRKEFPEVSDAELQEFNQLRANGRITEGSTNKVIQILKGSYDKITLQDSLLMDEVPRSLSKPQSLANRRAAPKSFTTWKNGEAMTNYLTEFGKYKTLSEQMEYYSRMTARDVGLTSIFGGNPKKGHEMIVAHVKEELKSQGKVPQEISDIMREIDIAWGNLTVSKAPYSGAVGRFFMHFRQAAAMAKLGKAGMTSFFLDPIMTSKQRRDLYNETLVRSVYETYKQYIPAMKDAAIRADIEDAYLYNQYEAMSNFEELYNLGGGMFRGDDKVSNALALGSEVVNKASLGYFFNKTSHITNARMYIKFLADAVNSGKMTPQIQADLAKFDINKNDLDIVSKLGLNTQEGMRNIFRLTVEEYRSLSPSSFDSHLDAADSLAAFKERMNGWLLEKIKTGAPIPGNRERRIFMGDTVAGTRRGEVARYMYQFKSTSLKVLIDSTYGSVRRNNPNATQAGFDKASWNNYHTYSSMGTLATHMTLMGGALLLFNAMLNNDDETIERFSSGDPTLVLDSFARGGGGLILGDIVSFNANWLQNMAQFGSPAIGAMAKIPANARIAVTGKPIKAAVDTAKTVIPGANLWFLSPFYGAMDNYVEKSSSARSKSILK